jgi:hypothetical protein
VFGDKMKAIELCVNRFDTDTKQAFLDLYTKVDDEVSMPETDDGGIKITEDFGPESAPF